MRGDSSRDLTKLDVEEQRHHVTLYAGWPKGMSAMGAAKQLFTDDK